jgi:hypothetical protein
VLQVKSVMANSVISGIEKLTVKVGRRNIQFKLRHLLLLLSALLGVGFLSRVSPAAFCAYYHRAIHLLIFNT